MTYTLTNNRCYEFMQKENILLNCVVNAFNITYNADDNSFFDNESGNILGWDEYKFIQLKSPITIRFEGEKDRVDGVLFFGDGTVEFRLESNMDALCWILFNNDEIDEVIKELENLF